MQTIGHILVSKGVISEEQLKEALKKKTGFLKHALIKTGLTTEEKFLRVIAEEYGASFLDLKETPIDPEAVKSYLSDLPGVTGVHDLHIWAMSTSETALTVHLVKPDTRDDDTLIKQASRELHERFGIEHITIQWERRPELDHCGSACEINV